MLLLSLRICESGCISSLSLPEVLKTMGMWNAHPRMRTAIYVKYGSYGQLLLIKTRQTNRTTLLEEVFILHFGDLQYVLFCFVVSTRSFYPAKNLIVLELVITFIKDTERQALFHVKFSVQEDRPMQ